MIQALVTIRQVGLAGAIALLFAGDRRSSAQDPAAPAPRIHRGERQLSVGWDHGR